jgi:hypothetical protein
MYIIVYLLLINHNCPSLICMVNWWIGWFWSCTGGARWRQSLCILRAKCACGRSLCCCSYAVLWWMWVYFWCFSIPVTPKENWSILERIPCCNFLRSSQPQNTSNSRLQLRTYGTFREIGSVDLSLFARWCVHISQFYLSYHRVRRILHEFHMR